MFNLFHLFENHHVLFYVCAVFSTEASAAPFFPFLAGGSPAGSNSNTADENESLWRSCFFDAMEQRVSRNDQVKPQRCEEPEAGTSDYATAGCADWSQNNTGHYDYVFERPPRITHRHLTRCLEA